MLFSGGSSTSKPKKEEKREKRREEKEVQELTGNKFDDVDSVFHALISDPEDPIFQLSIPEIVEGRTKTLLKMSWQLIQIYWRRFAPQGAGERKVAEALKDWCLEATAPYQGREENISITDFTDSWRDGIALNYLIHSYDDSLVDLDQILNERREDRVEYALTIAKKHFKVPKLIMPKEFTSDRLDQKSCVCYLMTLYLALVSLSTSTESSSRRSKRSGSGMTASVGEHSTSSPARGSPTISVQSGTHSPAPSSSTATTVVQSSSIQLSETPSDAATVIEHEPRSRKSSSSSQKSSRSRRSSRSRKNEELLKEYELCLEQVLTWLLAAEEEINQMDGVSEDADAVRRQFRDHEQFMQSLTESQDSVGRVLHRGQQLCQKVEEEQSTAIESQLVVVNDRWENLRALAMQRQLALKQQLLTLQREELERISDVLTDLEKAIANNKRIEDDPDESRRQIAEHARLQEQIEMEQSEIQKLSNFVVVVDEDGNAFAELETMLQSIGQRWMTICEWAELRAKSLDGLAQLIEQYENAYSQLSAWLREREDELTLFRSAHHLETDEEVMDQMRLLHKMESDLAAEHHSFVQLSQLCNELVLRFDATNGEAANRIRNQLDVITQMWNNIVSRLEEHSDMLVRSGKAKMGDIDRADADEEDGRGADTKREPQDTFEVAVTTSDDDSMPRALHFTSTPQAKPAEPIKTVPPPPEPQEESTPPPTTSLQTETPQEGDAPVDPAKDAAQQLVDEFLQKVRSPAFTVRPLVEWVNTVKMPKRKEEIREMVRMYQRKLREIKDLEPSANELTLLLEKIHDATSDPKQLHVVNESFELFMRDWQWVVIKISERMNALLHKEEKVDTAQITKKLGEWLNSTNAVLDDVLKISEKERAKRLHAIAEQLHEQQKNLVFLKQRHPSSDKDEELHRLENQLVELFRRVERYRHNPPSAVPADEAAEHETTPKPRTGEATEFPATIAEEAESLRHRLELEAQQEEQRDQRPTTSADAALQQWVQEKERQLKQGEAIPGDLAELEGQLQGCDALMGELKSKDATQSVEHLLKSAEIKRNNIVDAINKTQFAIHKAVRAEEIADGHKMTLDRLVMSSDVDLEETGKVLTEIRDAFARDIAYKQEASALLDEIAAIAARSQAPTRNVAISAMRGRIAKLEAQWQELGQEIDENLSCLKKEQRKCAESAVRQQTQLVDDLRKALAASYEATDAEELSECLDALERLLEQLSSSDGQQSLRIAQNLQENNLKDDAARLDQRKGEAVERARERCTKLREAISKCEHFEEALCNCQSWCNHMHHILDVRISSDIHALDVPHEYKKAFASDTLISQMDAEFRQYEHLLGELDAFIAESATQGISSDRLRLQLEHARSQLNELKVKFNEFKQPVQFIERMERSCRRLSEMENAIDDLTGIRAENCEYCLIHARQLAKQLEEVDAELNILEANRESLARAGILNKDQATDLGTRVNDALQNCIQLKGRANGVVQKLERCMCMLTKLAKENQVVQQLLDEAQQEPAVRHREGVREKLKQAEDTREKARELERLLKQNSIKLNDEAVKQRDARMETLKRQLSQWAEEPTQINESNYDNVNELRDVVEELSNAIDLMEAVGETDLAHSLEQHRPTKEKLQAEVASLEGRAGFEDLILGAAQVLSRWNSQERRLESIREEALKKTRKTPSTASLPRLDSKEVPEGAQFQQKVKDLLDEYRTAQEHLDFHRYPVTTVDEWSSRIKALKEFKRAEQPKLDDIVNEGRRLASQGRMELDVHEALEQLDNLVEAVRQLDADLDEYEERLKSAEERQNMLNTHLTQMAERIETLAARNFKEYSTAIVTQKDLMDARSQLGVLRRSAEELHGSLPGASSSQFESAGLDELNERLREIEERVQQALIKALVREQQKADDATSMSSGAGLSLAMEVNETEDELAEQTLEPQLIGSVVVTDSQRLTPEIRVDGADPLEQFYVNLDALDEYFDVPERLPYEGIDEKLQNLADYEKELNHGEYLVNERQMTMALTERDHVLGRVGSLRDKLAHRRHEITQRQTEIAALEGLFAQTEEMLANLGDQYGRSRKQRDPGGRERSPDIDELEATQLQMEDRLPPTAVHVQMCENRLQLMKEGMSTAQRERFETRLHHMAEDFSKYGSAIRDRRRHLEERLADQTHLNNHLELLEFWCDETEANISGEPSFLLLPELEDRLQQIEDRMREMPEKMDALHALENLKDRFVALASVEPDVKHEVRRNVTQLGKRLSNLRLDLNAKLKEFQAVKAVSADFWTEIERLETWIVDGNRQLEAVSEAKIYTPSMANVERLANEGAENIAALAQLEHEVEQLATASDYTDEAKKASIQRVKNLSGEFDKIIDRIQNVLREHNAVVAADSDDSDRASTDLQLQVQLDDGEAVSEKPSDEAETEVRTLTDTMSSRGKGPVDEKPLVRLITGQQSAVPTKERPRRMSLGEQARLDTVTRLRSWLQEVERDASITVDLVDQQIVRQLINKVQNWCDELNVNKLEMVHILDDSKDKLVRERAEHCRHDMEKVLSQCQRRKAELQRILEESRAWEQLCSATELWIVDASDKLNAGGKVKELTEEHLKLELQAVQNTVSELEPMKQKMSEINQRSNEMLEEFPRDDGHNLSHLTSKLNTHWTKFNDNIRIRKAALEASIRSRNDFHSGLAQFEEWLDKETKQVDRLHEDTNNTQRLKDTSRRKDWMALQKEARIEIDAHADVMESVRQMGYKLLENMEEGVERSQLSDRLCKIGQAWMHLTNTDRIIRERLENAQEECERLTQTLSDLIYWTETQTARILEDQPVAGDLDTVQKQRELVKGIEKEAASRENLVAETIQLAHSYLMQHDLRPAMHSSSVLDPFQDEVKTDAEREERRVGVQILADSEKLKSSWELLKQHCRVWSAVVGDAHRDMQELDKAIAESLLAIGAIEEDIDRRRPVEELRLEELKEARVDNADLRRRCHDANVKIDDVNDWAGQIVAKNVSLSKPLDAQIHAVNQRYEKLKRSIAIRGAALERAFVDFGPSSEHFLVDSVEPPWQRAISTSNHLPYYIDHDSEKTQWDHPAMVEILEQLCSFNQVKFSAYRTAMKLRALQKRLCLDLIDLPDLTQSFQRLHDYASDDRLKLEDMVLCLVPLFERVHQQFPHLMKNVPLAVDLVINLLLNIYDPCRDGKMRAISFKFALIVLCNANLESKYKYLFHLISTNEGVGHKQLAVLFYDLIHITKFLGEAAAFGGSNVEPSVRSCFEHSKYPPTLSIDGFLEWLKKEPQSLVWLPVMHRLASSEFAKHQAKCNACKMYPIVGLRYRCLRCFNYDICQSCFFSQRTSKNHKLTHPMQEYCLPTNSRDDVRDFTAMVKNKVRRARNKIGYLPVETVDEGAPLEQTSTVPQNPSSDPMHQRISLMAHRLQKRHLESQSAAPAIGPTVEAVRTVAIEGATEPHKESKLSLQNGSLPAAFRNGTAADVKSPSQLISQVDQMHKEELDTLLQKLQYENVELKRAMEEKKRQVALGSMPNLEYRYRQRTHDQYQTNGSHGVGQNVYASAHTMPIRPSAAPTTAAAPMTSPHVFRHHISQPALAHINGAAMGGTMPRDRHGRSVPSLRPIGVSGVVPDSEADAQMQATDVQMLSEARNLRLHQQRLEQRSRVLEEQNRQLQMQLERLQKMVEKRSASTANIDEVSVLAQVPPESWTVPRTGAPVPPFGADTAYGIYSTDEEDTLAGADAKRNRMQALQTTVEDLNRALESFVVSLCDSPDVVENGEA